MHAIVRVASQAHSPAPASRRHMASAVSAYAAGAVKPDLVNKSLGSPARGGAPRAALLEALFECARDNASYLHTLPTLGPLQLVEQCVRRATFSAGAVSPSPGSFVRAFGRRGDGAGEFAGVSGVCLLADGTTAVSDMDNLRVQLFARTAGVAYAFVRAFGAYGSGVSDPDCAIGLAATSDDRVVLVNKKSGRLIVYRSDAKLLQRITVLPLSSELYGVAVLSDNRFVVSDSRHGVVVLDNDGTTVREIGSSKRGGGGGGADSLRPRGVAVTPTDDIVVTDDSNLNVRVFRPDGSAVRTLSNQSGGARFAFHAPDGVAVDSGGAVVVTDRARHAVQVFRADGTFMRAIGGGDDWLTPRGVCINAAGEVLVCNSWKHRVDVWS